MNQFFKSLMQSTQSFVEDEEGAQIVEYALIIALVSIVLALAMGGLDNGFTSFKARVTACLTGGACT